MESLAPQPPTVADLRNDNELWYKLHVFIYDLRNFREAPKSQERLDSIADSSCIGLPYFTSSEAQTIKATMNPNLKSLEVVIEETLNERLERRFKKREESGDFRVCAAHDLAPILEKALGINSRDLARDKGFLEVMGRCGLELGDGEVWKGVQK
ncbi:hypothetical protein DL98DRAFT_495968, partial [Cadophora sp. DSE1049]